MRSSLGALGFAFAGSLVLAACSPSSTPPHEAAVVPSAAPAASQPPVASALTTEVPAPPATPTPSAPTAAPAPSSPPPPSVTVKVANIGIHVGGGPFDEPTKEPIKKSVAPHLAGMASCYPLAETKGTPDVGVDLLIPEKGGRAQVSHPRATLLPGGAPREAFLACVVKAFEGVDFLPPATGRSTVSYSIRFTPAPSRK